MTKANKSLSVECPKCKVKERERCVGTSGYKKGKPVQPHAERITQVKQC